MKKNLFWYGLFSCLLLSCSNPSTETLNAGIFERKQLPDGSLMVYYAFAKNGLTFKDSAEVKNDTILKDSVKVQYSSKTPEKTTILLP